MAVTHNSWLNTLLSPVSWRNCVLQYTCLLLHLAILPLPVNFGMLCNQSCVCLCCSRITADFIETCCYERACQREVLINCRWWSDPGYGFSFWLSKISHTVTSIISQNSAEWPMSTVMWIHYSLGASGTQPDLDQSRLEPGSVLVEETKVQVVMVHVALAEICSTCNLSRWSSRVNLFRWIVQLTSCACNVWNWCV